jgi:ABC-type branched-subunit amino acid transport system permease subunit
LIGPILGAAFFMTLEHQLSSYTEAWASFFGLVFIAFVLFAPGGIWGLARTWFQRAVPAKPDFPLAQSEQVQHRG